MLRRTMQVALALTLVMAAGTTWAQPDPNCVISPFGRDGAGNFVPTIVPARDPGLPAAFDVFYLLSVDDFVNAVAWNREFTGFSGGFGVDLFLTEQDIVPTYGTFVDIQPEGFRLGIGTCVIVGFGFGDVVLARERFLLNADASGGQITVTANTLENPDWPVYNTCSNDIVPCNGGELQVFKPIPTESRSWGKVKALYSN